MTETIYDALRESHETQRALFRKVLRSKPGTRDRIALFTELRVELSAHEAAEERYLYVPILMDDMGLDSSRHALHEHHQIDELVEEVQSLSPTGDAWLDIEIPQDDKHAVARKLVSLIAAHYRRGNTQEN